MTRLPADWRNYCIYLRWSWQALRASFNATEKTVACDGVVACHLAKFASVVVGLVDDGGAATKNFICG